MTENRIEAIPCEVRRAADPQVFHVIEKKTGKDKLVSFGRLFPLRTTNRFLMELERDFKIQIVNRLDFMREVKAEVKAKK
jgi:hypothetical protein